MKNLFLYAITIFLTAGVFGYSSSTVPIQSETQVQQQQVCNGLEVGEVDYNTTIEGDVLDFQGVFCAPNIGYTIESSSIDVEDGVISAGVYIQRPDGVSGPAVTPVRFSESSELPPGSYDLNVRVEVQGHHNISDNSEIEIEGQRTGLMSRVRSFFMSLFR